MKMNDLDYIYLASPYNHKSVRTRQKRIDAVTAFGFKLIQEGLNVFCPITQSSNLQKTSGDKLTHEEWMRVDIAFLSKAKLLVVFCLDGWMESVGVKEEIDYAVDPRNDIPVVYVHPDHLLGVD